MVEKAIHYIARVLGLAVEQVLLSDEKVLVPVARLVGRLAPKSIVASGTGLYFAQNVMYQHTISVFDADKQLVKTVEDTVDLRAFGYDVPGESYRGAPVEAAFTSDGSHAFVSNYRMYGPGYDPRAGGDICGKDRGQRSFVYRISAATLSVDGVYEAGPVPKFMAVTPDDRLLVVSNWCGYDVSVIDLKTRRILAEVEVGRYPRGIAVTGDSAIAYVAVMGSTDIAVIDIAAISAGVLQGPDAVESYTPYYLRDIGHEPRHLVLSPDGDVLYATLNGEGAVVALNSATGQELLRVRTGEQPRSMDISDDGTALYVVNYGSDTMTKLRAADLAILQTLDTAPRPIGVTYDSFNDEVWVSAYSGVIHVYAERQQVPPPCARADCEAVFDTLPPGIVEPGSGPAGDRLRDRTAKAQMSACMAFRLNRGRLEGRIHQRGVSHRVLESDLRRGAVLYAVKPDRDLLDTVTRNRKCGDPHCHAGLSRVADASCDGCYPTASDVGSIARARKLAICARVTTFPGQKRGGSVAQPAAMSAAVRASNTCLVRNAGRIGIPRRPNRLKIERPNQESSHLPRVTVLSGQKRGESAAHPIG